VPQPVTFPLVCRDLQQFQNWQKSRPWLIMALSGSVKCATCAAVKNLGLHASSGQHEEIAFVAGAVTGCSTAKKLLKKIDRHRDCGAHNKCTKILEVREKDRIGLSLRAAQSLFEERHKENIEATTKVFRTAYECAKSQLSFAEHSRLVVLQQLNGVSCGNMLFSENSCASIVEHVGSEMRLQIIDHIVKHESKFAILVDESTSVSNEQSIIVYVRTVINDSVCVYFLGLLPVESATAQGLKETLLSFLHSVGLTDEVMRMQFIGFCSGGASNMIGQHNGLAALLTATFPLIKSFHCMAHRLELAVKQSTDTVNSVSHFRDLVDAIYKVYSMSPKNQREIDIIAEDLAVQFMKVQKVFDVRWVFSSFMSVTALLTDLPALHAHFVKLSSPV
jgi:predicted RNA-binding protein with RPS1 domain